MLGHIYKLQGKLSAVSRRSALTGGRVAHLRVERPLRPDRARVLEVEVHHRPRAVLHHLEVVHLEFTRKKLLSCSLQLHQSGCQGEDWFPFSCFNLWHIQWQLHLSCNDTIDTCLIICGSFEASGNQIFTWSSWYLLSTNPPPAVILTRQILSENLSRSRMVTMTPMTTRLMKGQ